jgi:hypothetical protein
VNNTGSSWNTTALPSLDVLQRHLDPAQNPGYQSFSRMTGNNPSGGEFDYRVLNFTMSANLADDAPVANAGSDVAVRAGDTVFLDGTGSFDDNTGSEGLSFNWSITSAPAGSTAALTGADTATPSLVIDVPGTYEVSLVVTDSLGQPSEPSIVTISSENLAPTSVAGADQLVLTGTAVSLDGSASFDPESDMLSYAWDLTSAPVGSTSSVLDPNSAVTSIVPDVEGAYQVTLQVSDSLGPGSSDSVTITAITLADFIEEKILIAAAHVEDLGKNDVTTKGNQRALHNHLVQAVTALGEGDLLETQQKLAKALDRIDGCTLRGSADGNGRDRDWVTSCNKQAPIYDLVNDALQALNDIIG